MRKNDESEYADWSDADQKTLMLLTEKLSTASV
jgi:hypothetical protein